jgi:hypothetical protein
MAVENNGVADPAAATLTNLARTDSQGRYRLENVPPGRYFITAGFLDSPSYYPGVRTPAEARSINVVAGSATTGIDFTARPNGVRLSGRISNLPPSAPPGLFRATLPHSGMAGADSQTPDVPVGPDGTFEFSNVRPGSYRILLTPNGPPSPIFEVGGDNLEGIELTATPMVFGRVTVEDGSPLPVRLEAVAGGVKNPPALLELQAAKTGGLGTARAAPRRDGFFVFVFQAPGEYTLTPALLATGYYLKSATHHISF